MTAPWQRGPRRGIAVVVRTSFDDDEESKVAVTSVPVTDQCPRCGGGGRRTDPDPPYSRYSWPCDRCCGTGVWLSDGAVAERLSRYHDAAVAVALHLRKEGNHGVQCTGCVEILELYRLAEIAAGRAR